MLSSEAQSAYLTLQSVALAAKDNYTIDRVERALDEIIRNPENTKPAAHQARSAWANAGKVLQNRRTLVRQVPLDTPGLDLAQVEGAYAAVDILGWLDLAAVSAGERALLQGLAGGNDARMLADVQGIPVQRMRERIARARRAGSIDYHATVVAA